MEPVMDNGAVTTVGRGRPGAARPSRRPLILYDLITAIQDVVGLGEDGLVVAIVRHLLRSGRLTGPGPESGGAHRSPKRRGGRKV